MSIAPERPPANSPIRFSIAVVLALVGMLGLFLGAMRNGSALAMKLTWTATALALLVGLLGALVRRGEAAWVGFALFGWGYALHSLDRVVAPNLYQKFVFADVLEAIVPEMHPMPSSRPVVPAINGQFLRQFGGEAYVARVDDPGLLATLTDPELDLLRDFQAKFLAFQRSEDIVRSRADRPDPRLKRGPRGPLDRGPSIVSRRVDRGGNVRRPS
jgi:hypothetical protein